MTLRGRGFEHDNAVALFRRTQMVLNKSRGDQ
jgi:hypothetical protein